MAVLLRLLGRRGERRLRIYLGGFALLWLLTPMSGVHATVAGVIAALVIPLPLAERLEHALRPGVMFGIVPLFGFANAGVAVNGIGIATLTEPRQAGGIFGSVDRRGGRYRAATDTIRIGVLAGSILSAVTGFLVLWFAGRASQCDVSSTPRS